MAAERPPSRPDLRAATARDRLCVTFEAILLASLGEGPSVAEAVAGEVAALLDAEVAWVLRVFPGEEGGAVVVAGQVGLSAAEIERVTVWLATTPPDRLGYDLAGLECHRNVVEILPAGRGVPPQDGRRICRIADLEQLGVLVCDGAVPLAWVGAFRAELMPDHRRLFARLVPVLRCALALGRRGSGGAAVDLHENLDVRLARAARAWELTERQVEVLRRVIQGEGNKEIATRLGCAPVTVERHVTSLLRRAGVDRRSALAAAIWKS